MSKVQDWWFSGGFICLCSWANLTKRITCMATDNELLLHALFNGSCESPRQNLARHPQELDLSRLQDGYTTNTGQ